MRSAQGHDRVLLESRRSQSVSERTAVTAAAAAAERTDTQRQTAGGEDRGGRWEGKERFRDASLSRENEPSLSLCLSFLSIHFFPFPFFYILPFWSFPFSLRLSFSTLSVRSLLFQPISFVLPSLSFPLYSLLSHHVFPLFPLSSFPFPGPFFFPLISLPSFHFFLHPFPFLSLLLSLSSFPFFSL